ncbi:MAG: heavy metal-associated domain-containing protein, partial [Pseudomonadota bacterium]
MTEHALPLACPGCAAAPMAAVQSGKASPTDETLMSLPTIHCAACMASVEAALAAVPGVASAEAIQAAQWIVGNDIKVSSVGEALPDCTAAIGAAA